MFQHVKNFDVVRHRQPDYSSSACHFNFFFFCLTFDRQVERLVEFTTGVANLCLKNEVLETCCTRLYTHATQRYLTPPHWDPLGRSDKPTKIINSTI